MKILKQIFPLTLISSLRFFGLFVVMPVISVYALSLGASPLMVGLAVGGYALTQIIFQTPFGILGDKFDKRTIIALGLILFIAGSLLCAYTDNLYLLIAGRMLQGSGAIASVITALISDLTPEEQRTKAMALMGGGISISFLLAMLIGPFVGGHYGMKSLFWITALLASFALLILIFKVPKAQKIQYCYEENFKHIHYLKDPNLWVMYLSSFLQKALVNLGFVLIPLVLHQDFGFNPSDLWKFYAPAGILGIFAMAPASIMAEKYGRYKTMMSVGIIAFGICFFLFCLSDYYHTLWVFVLGIIVFFVGFDIHEPIMQSLSSKYPKAFQRSSALGLFTTFGFLGSFLGAVIGGILYSKIGLFYLSLGVGIVAIFWILLLLIVLKNPIKQKTLFLSYSPAYNLSKLAQMQGVSDYYHTEKTLIIQYNPLLIEEEKIKEVL